MRQGKRAKTATKKDEYSPGMFSGHISVVIIIMRHHTLTTAGHLCNQMMLNIFVSVKL
jgi:hypothetical protein